MKIHIHPEILKRQRYSCICCGAGCRSFLVGLRPAERGAITGLDDWAGRLAVEDLFVRHRSAGRLGFGLAKHRDGRCIFLDDQNLCLVHKEHGLEAKPLACQLYPFVLSPLAGRLFVGLRFDCPAVVDNHGDKLGRHVGPLHQLCKKLITPDIEALPPPAFGPAIRLEPNRLLTINEAFLKILTADDLSLHKRLQGLLDLVGHLERVKWDRLGDADFSDLIGLLRDGALAECRRYQPQRRPLPARGRTLLGQIFFLLSQPTTVITGTADSLGRRIVRRLGLQRSARRMGRPNGALPKVQPAWPDVDLKELESSFGPWTDQIDALLTRHLVCRLGGLNYCGENFYRYSMREGIQTLILGMVTAGWLMRISAAAAGRDHLVEADGRQALLTIDGNLGYSTALGFGPSRLRLRYLKEYLRDFLDWYCI